MLKDYLKEYRLNNNYTQQEMAEKLDTSQNYYSLLECGKRNPGIGMLKKISALLKLKPNVLRGILNENDEQI